MRLRPVRLPQVHTRPPSIDTPTPPRVISCRCTQGVHLPRRAPATPPYVGNAQASSSRSLSAHPGGASPGKGSRHVSHIRTSTPPLVLSCLRTQLVHIVGEAPATPFYLGTPTPLSAVCYRRTYLMHLPGGGPCLPRLHTSAILRCLRSSPSGASTWCISGEGPLPRLLTWAIPIPHPAVSYLRTQVVHLLGGAFATPSYIGTSTPSPVVNEVDTSPGRER